MASEARLQALEAPGEYALSGVLDFTSVVALQQAGISPLQGEATSLRIDLAGVEHANSAGLALLIHWWRAARQAQRELQFLHLPPQLQALAQVSGLESILPITRA